jgi:hypothetical protein
MKVKTGAGVIPVANNDGVCCFLFHKTFSGRRAGLLVDFGGGSRAGESQVQTAAREFVEETEAMFFASNCNSDLKPQFDSQCRLMLQLIARTLDRNPRWWCGRKNRTGGRPRDWKTFFVEVDYKDPAAMNTAWARDSSTRFKKRRELIWLTADELLSVIDNEPDALWNRIREYEQLRETVLVIQRDITQSQA